MSASGQPIVILRWVAIGSVAGALLVTVGAFRYYRATAPRILLLRGELAELEKIKASLRDAGMAMSALQSVNRRIPVNLKALIQREGCGAWCRVSDTRIRQLLPGWLLYEAEISLQGIPAARLSRLVSALENSRPPWRVRKYHLKGAGGDNSIDGEMRLRAVGKEPQGKTNE